MCKLVVCVCVLSGLVCCLQAGGMCLCFEWTGLLCVSWWYVCVF